MTKIAERVRARNSGQMIFWLVINSNFGLFSWKRFRLRRGLRRIGKVYGDVVDDFICGI